MQLLVILMRHTETLRQRLSRNSFPHNAVQILSAMRAAVDTVIAFVVDPNRPTLADHFDSHLPFPALLFLFDPITRNFRVKFPAMPLRVLSRP